MKRIIYIIEFLLKFAFCIFTVYVATINVNSIPATIIIGIVIWEFVLKDSLHNIADVEDVSCKQKILSLEKEIENLKKEIESISKK